MQQQAAGSSIWTYGRFSFFVRVGGGHEIQNRELMTSETKFGRSQNLRKSAKKSKIPLDLGHTEQYRTRYWRVHRPAVGCWMREQPAFFWSIMS